VLERKLNSLAVSSSALMNTVSVLEFISQKKGCE